MERRKTGGYCPNKGLSGSRLWCPGCYANLKGISSDRSHRFNCSKGCSHRAYSRPHYSEVIAMKRENEEKQKRVGKFVAPADATLNPFPHLSAYLGDAWWDDGQVRDLPALSITLTTDGVQLSIVDIKRRRSTSTNARTLLEGLDLVEALCASPPLPWRSWGPSKGK